MVIQAIKKIFDWLKGSNKASPQPLVDPPLPITDDGIPVPPLDLIYLVVGTREPVGFIEGGKKIAHQGIVDALHKHQLDLNDFQAVLDFGCGCGRLMRHWKSLTKPRLYGTDYNPVLIEWCKSNLPFAQFQVNQLEPPLNYSDSQFDFIFAGSVFTHFPEALQFAWLTELRRILMHGGYLMLTTSGEHYAKNLPLPLQKRFYAGQFVAIQENQAGTNLCSAYHSEKYVRENLTRHFAVVDFIPTGWDTQDIVLLRK